MKLDEQDFSRKVKLSLAQQLVSGMDDEILADLFAICEDGISLRAFFKDKRKTKRFHEKLRERTRLLAKLGKLSGQMQDALKMSRSSFLAKPDFARLNYAIRELADVIDSADMRLRAIQSMAKKARRTPYPRTLSVSLNDFLTIHHNAKWNQKVRDLIVAACFEAGRVSPGEVAEIADRIPMQRHRAVRQAAKEEGRVVHRPGAATRGAAEFN